DRLVPGCREALCHRCAGPQRDLVLAGAPAADHRDPHGVPPPPVVVALLVVSVVVSGAVKSPTVSVTRSPGLRLVPPLGAWARTIPSSEEALLPRLTTETDSPAAASLRCA